VNDKYLYQKVIGNTKLIIVGLSLSDW